MRMYPSYRAVILLGFIALLSTACHRSPAQVVQSDTVDPKANEDYWELVEKQSPTTWQHVAYYCTHHLEKPNCPTVWNIVVIENTVRHTSIGSENHGD